MKLQLGWFLQKQMPALRGDAGNLPGKQNYSRLRTHMCSSLITVNDFLSRGRDPN